ncbi:PLP-dependent cysteine synthase family protein [Thermodesulfobacteriota bacterium]
MKRNVYDNIVDLVADKENPTPLVKINNLTAGENYELYLKLEQFNPFGSIKDRTAKYLINGLKERGELDGKEIVEPSSGNTGIALAAIANIHGVKTTVTIPDAVPEEKQTILRMLGATVYPTPDDLCPINHPKDGAIALAHSIAKSGSTKDRYVMPNQYENNDNIKAHYETTGPEIFAQTEGKVKYFFAGYGTCGTITGIGRYLKEKIPDVKIIAIEPQKGHRLPGLKNFQESKKPDILDTSVIDETIVVMDDDAYSTSIELMRKESLLIGPSTGAIVYAAKEYMKGRDGLAVAISPDGAFKYVSFYHDLVKDDGKPEV